MTEGTKAKAKQLINGREMLSHIRSAFAFQDRVLLYLDETPTECVIISFNDADLRNVDLDRDIEITLPKTLFHSNTKSGQEMVLEIILDSAKLKLLCTLADIRSNSLVIRLPKEGELHQVRTSNRFSLADQDWSDAVIFSETLASPCVLKITDFSSGGIGVVLATTIDITKIGKNLLIKGDSATNNYHFKGPYSVKRIQLLKESESYFEYSVGLIDIVKDAQIQNNLRAGRHAVESNLQLFVNASNTKLNVKVSDVSISGFRALVPSQSIQGLAKDLVATEISSQIKFKIIRLGEDGQTAFQLLSQEPNDQIRWLNLIMPFLSGGRIDVNVVDSRSLVNLFFEAGASIVDGLEYKRFRLTQKDALSLLTTQSDVLIRWVNIGKDGTLLGHHSTYRVGLNSWYTGDVVGGQTEDNKADRTFFNDNFKILKETIEGFSTQQKILGSWKPNHPYWQTWRNYLLDNNLSYCMELCDYVTRNQVSPLAHENLLNSKFFELDSHALYEALNSLSKGLQWFLSSIDIHPMSNTAASTNEIYLKHEKPGFKRSVHKLETEMGSYLVVLSQLPPGFSINPVFDCAFIFPLSEKSRDQDRLYSLVLCLGSANGFRVTSLRFFSPDVKPIGSLTEFFVIDSKGLGVFK